MKITTEPRSDQWNADDLIGGPRTVTVVGVRVGTAEQKYDILLHGEERVWRPPLTVLRLLVAGWGEDAGQWEGRRATLYRDDSIRFGKDAVGGIRVSHMSHLDKPLRIALTATRGKRVTHTVEPLVESSPTPDELAAQIAAALTDATTEAEVREWGNRAHGRNLLDLVVDGMTVRDRVAARLAEVTPAEQTAGEESARGVEAP